MTIQNKQEHTNYQEWQFVPQKKNTSLKHLARVKERAPDPSCLILQQTQSICIPRVDQSLSRNYIYSVFEKLDVGTIEALTEIPLRNDPTHKRILIKIRWNRNNELSYKLQEQLKTTGSMKLVYDMPWYWKIVSTHPQI